MSDRLSDRQRRAFSPTVQAVIAECVPIIKKWDVGRYAITIGGSQGKDTWDERSDIDFRLYHERDLPWPHLAPELWTDFQAAEARWRERGVNIDGVWPRGIAAIDSALQRWMDGQIEPVPMVWSVWGYHLLPDLHYQVEIEDPFGIVAGWKERLSAYPPKLKAALLKKHGDSLRYWRNDYHYRNKVARGDAVFLASLSARLVHDMMQVLFALNERYYVGDGQNLDFARGFALRPANLDARIYTALYPQPSGEGYEAQYAAICALIDDVLAFAVT